MPTISEADADAESEEQLDEQFKMANDAITGLSRAIDQAKTTIAERETELSQADPGQVEVLQRELTQLKTQLEKDEAGFAAVMSAKGGTREGQVVSVKSFDDILRVSISCIRTRWTTRWRLTTRSRLNDDKVALKHIHPFSLHLVHNYR